MNPSDFLKFSDALYTLFFYILLLYSIDFEHDITNKNKRLCNTAKRVVFISWI